MSVGEIAALIAAGAFLMLVVVLAVPILRLRHTVDAATRTHQRSQRPDRARSSATSTPRWSNVNIALTQVHTTLDGVNLQLARLDTITAHAAQVTANVANLATVVTSAAANPLTKAAAFGFGVRRRVGTAGGPDRGGRADAAARLKAAAARTRR